MKSVGGGARKAPGRTYQNLLKNQHDEEKLRYFLASRMVKVDILSKSLECEVLSQTKEGNGSLINGVQCSPDGRFLLVNVVTELSYGVPLGRFGKSVLIWDLDSDQTLELASLPVDDEIPLSNDACSRHQRSFQFHPCHPHTILYAHALDGGDPKNEPIDGERDALYTRDIIVGDDGSISLQKDATKLIGLEWRLDDVDFCETGMALVDEYRWKDRMERKWKLDPEGAEKTLVWERSWEDRYNSPGAPLTRRGANGQWWVVQPTPTSIYLKGAGASSLGDRPFLDRMDFSEGGTHATTRLWRCKAPVEGEVDVAKEVGGNMPTDRQDIFESLVTLFPDNETLMISRESKTTPRNYYLVKLGGSSDSEIQVTEFPHPQPDLLGVTKELVKYQRKDGVDLTANLYLPPDYDGTPRPTLFWAYPREFKDGKAAGQIKGSKYNFVSASWASPIHWAAVGWAVMDDFSMPVIGEGENHPNDSFVEQIVLDATAAVEYAASRGVCDPERCAVGGHSYGAFMTANLLSHTNLFAAGIGRSGAYNRTLTPMSFQSEDRSIWETPDTYIAMSPLMEVKKYSEQSRVGKLLLIHGENDENSGTHPMQSDRYFSALKAFGIESRLVTLPHERHSYRSRESILHMAWEQEQWLKSLEEGSHVGSPSS